MPGRLQVTHSGREAMNKRERDTRQRGRYIYLALMAGVLALAGWSSRPAQAALPSTDPKVAVTATNLPAGWTAGPIGIVPDPIDQKQSGSVDRNGGWTIQANGHDLWKSDDGGLFFL